MADEYPDPYAGLRKRPAADEGYPDPYADLRVKPSRSVGQQALDVAKQIPAGLVAGTEAIATFPAQIAGLVGPLADKGLPSWLVDPEAVRQQEELRALGSKARGGGIADYLPKPETTAGEYARTGAEFVPAAIGGGAGSPIRAGVVGLTTGLASEGAGQLTKGTAAEPYARIGTALATGHVAGRMAEAGAVRNAITDLREGAEREANRLYTQFRNSGFQLDPATGAHYAVPTRAFLATEGLSPITAEPVHRVLDAIERTPFTNPAQLQERYKELGALARSPDSSVRRAAGLAQERLLQLAENPPPYLIAAGDPAAGVELLRRANADWAGLARAERASTAINAAELRAASQYSGLNLENQLRQRLAPLSDPRLRAGFSPDEQRAIRGFTQESYPGANIVRYGRHYLGGGGGLGALAAGTAASGAGAYYGMDPLAYGGATTLAGLGLAMYGNRRALNAARDLELRLLQRTPYAAQAGVDVTQPRGMTFLAPLMADQRTGPPTLADLGD